MNEPTSPVCAFDEKCGNIRDFESEELATLSNYTVAHCGPCGVCSTWNDFPLQNVSSCIPLCLVSHSRFLKLFLQNSSSKMQLDLATAGRNCGQQNFIRQGEDFFTNVQQCIEKSIGFTPDCGGYLI